MEANYNEPNFFARIFDCKMVIWEEKAPQSRGMWALRDSNPRPSLCKRDALTN